MRLPAVSVAHLGNTLINSEDWGLRGRQMQPNREQEPAPSREMVRGGHLGLSLSGLSQETPHSLPNAARGPFKAVLGPSSTLVGVGVLQTECKPQFRNLAFVTGYVT